MTAAVGPGGRRLMPRVTIKRLMIAIGLVAGLQGL
jgi:hypothetical protein